MKRVILQKVIPNTEDYTLKLFYNNGEIKIFDTKPSLKNFLEVLKDKTIFERAFIEGNSVCFDIDPKVDSNIHWNNRIDFCADGLYLDSKLVDKNEYV